MYISIVYFNCTFQLYISIVDLNCTFQLYISFVHFNCTFQLYISIVHFSYTFANICTCHNYSLWHTPIVLNSKKVIQNIKRKRRQNPLFLVPQNSPSNIYDALLRPLLDFDLFGQTVLRPKMAR